MVNCSISTTIIETAMPAVAAAGSDDLPSAAGENLEDEREERDQMEVDAHSDAELPMEQGDIDLSMSLDLSIGK